MLLTIVVAITYMYIITYTSNLSQQSKKPRSLNPGHFDLPLLKGFVRVHVDGRVVHLGA